MTLGPAERAIIDDLLMSQRPRIVLDVGAYVGYSALMLGGALLDLYPDEDERRGCKVVSFEKDP